ncbi:MAG: hypothetical protein WCJ58_09020, partial [bacterium]
FMPMRNPKLAEPELAVIRKWVADGLLEKLESWVFVEWSKANELTQDVNYPTNMLYSAMLAATGRLYKDSNLINKANKLKDTICEKSFNGTFFTDNAICAYPITT